MVQPVGDADASQDRNDRTRVDIDPASAVRVVVVALCVAAAFAVVQQAPAMLTKIGVGVVLALALDPVVVRVQHRLRWQRGTAVGLVGLLLGVVFLGVLVVLGPAAIEEAGNLRSDLPATIEDSYSWPIIGDRLSNADVAQRVEDGIDDLPSTLDDASLTRYAEDLLGGLLTTVVVLVTAIAVLSLIHI